MIFETELSLQFDILQFWITLDKNNGTVQEDLHALLCLRSSSFNIHCREACSKQNFWKTLSYILCLMQFFSLSITHEVTEQSVLIFHMHM